MNERKPVLRCSFCGKSDQEVKKLVAGATGVYICDECVELAGQIMRESSELEAGE